MAIYKVCLIGPAGKIGAIQQFSAESDNVALAIARGMTKEDSWFAGFELWLGRRRIRPKTQKRHHTGRGRSHNAPLER